VSETTAPGEYQEFLVLAERTARAAGQMLREAQPRVHQVEYKGTVNLVTEMDTASEEFIVNEISSGFPEHAIIAEEGSEVDNSSEYRWYVDPLDGTTNYAHGLPIYCVSLGLERSGELICGVVYDPSLDEMFTAVVDGGAFLNGKRIHVSAETELIKSLLVTGFPYDIRETELNNLDNFATFAKRARAVRRLGSAAMDSCWTAAGRFDGFWELKLSAWDMAAGVLICREAGGLVTDFGGEPYDLHTGRILATNGFIHQPMQDVLAEVAAKRSS
jgi:myo-inositol-1(or 4)-monophosphatase